LVLDLDHTLLNSAKVYIDILAYEAMSLKLFNYFSVHAVHTFSVYRSGTHS